MQYARLECYTVRVYWFPIIATNHTLKRSQNNSLHALDHAKRLRSETNRLNHWTRRTSHLSKQKYAFINGAHSKQNPITKFLQQQHNWMNVHCWHLLLSSLIVFDRVVRHEEVIDSHIPSLIIPPHIDHHWKDRVICLEFCDLIWWITEYRKRKKQCW